MFAIMPSRIVCFVCGSLGGEFPLHSCIRESGAYFPFLEHHDPPKGSRIPGADGIVDSCRVCYAFLTQQWEAYEHTNTPAIKRLYWLKRLDDGQFTGAEMKLQGEYMAQVMGLQYQPSCGDNNCGPMSPDESGSYSREGFGLSGDRQKQQQQQQEMASAPDGALDLSVPISKPETTGSRKKNRDEPKSNGNRPSSKSVQSKTCVDEYGFVCYTCGVESQGVIAQFISSAKHPDHEQYYPFLAKLTPPKGARPINSQGICQVCEHCFLSLRHQWISYEHHGTPNCARIFKVNGFFFSNDSSITGAAPQVQDAHHDGSLEACYLCSQSYHHAKLCPLFTSGYSSQDEQMIFPFIRELRRPNGARPLMPDGSVRVCHNCFQNLRLQWQHYESEKVPVLMRRYSLGSFGNIPPPSSQNSLNLAKPQPESTPHSSVVPQSSSDSSTSIKSALHPLNIEVPRNPDASAATRFNVQSTSTHETHTHPGSLPSYSAMEDSTGRSQHGAVIGDDSKTQMNNLSQPIPHPLLQAGERPKKVCFICGEKCLQVKMQILYSYPAKHETKMPGHLQVMPFFPFLANREPAHGADAMTEEGTVLACAYCFFSLFNQWRDYEESKNATDKNCWLRKYATNEFACFVCSQAVRRRKMRMLEVKEFPFLREHKPPAGALVMWGGEAVGVCSSCQFSLNHQFADYERMGVPPEAREYNWTVHSSANTNDTGNDEGQDNVRSFFIFIDYYLRLGALMPDFVAFCCCLF